MNSHSHITTPSFLQSLFFPLVLHMWNVKKKKENIGFSGKLKLFLQEAVNRGFKYAGSLEMAVTLESL